ncbi:MAG: rubrerythrin family protein [Candidatus Thorarchaeota archaeon]|nr:MAG: rubrerythrin family protein [Candidatus Thorarchaeota archaeon]
MELKGTETEKNLLISFAGESQARNRYTFWASIARKEGFMQIAQVFQETADQEKEHAERFFKFLVNGGASPEIEITATYPAGPLGSTLENLRAAAEGERYEWQELYPGFADVAEKEGFKDIAFVWRKIAEAEKWHHERYTILADNVESGRVFKRDNKIKWRCMSGGYIHVGEEPPERCPSCDHPKSYFMVHNANF